MPRSSTLPDPSLLILRLPIAPPRHSVSDTSFSGSRPCPDARHTLRIQGDFLVVDMDTHYRVKTNSYVVERIYLLSIMRSSGR